MATEYLQRKDSDGVVHYVDRQNEPMSCALACIGMAWQTTRHQCLINAAEEKLKTTSGAFSGSLLASQTAGDNNGLGNGTSANNMTATLGKIGINVSQLDNFYPQGSANFAWRKDRIRTGYPAIILVGWYAKTAAGEKRNGGHFIVAPRVTKSRSVVILDPASGTLHELQGNAGFYFNHSLRGRIDMIWYTG